MIVYMSEIGVDEQLDRRLYYTHKHIKIYAQIAYDRFVLELGDSIEA